MGGMLEGKEIEGKIGEVGSYSVDVTKEGKISIEASVKQPFLDGAGEAKIASSVDLDLFAVLEKIAAKNGKPWIATSVESVRNILGIIG